MSVLTVGRFLSGAATLVLVAGLASSPAFAASTLEEALSQAYETNPTLLAERARLRATDESVAQAVSNWRPTVTATGTYADVESRTDFAAPGTPTFSFGSDPFAGNVTASQNIFRGFRSINQLRQAEAGVRAGRAQLHFVEQGVLLDAVTAYTDVIRDEAVVTLRENNVTVLARQLEASQDRFDLGDNTRTDVAQSEARHSRARSNLTVSEAQMTASRASFERVIGSSPVGLQNLASIPEVPSTEAAVMSAALANNPNLQAAIEAEIVSRRAVDIAMGALLPSVRVDGTLSHNEDTGGFFFGTSQSDSRSITGVLTIPLYQAGAEHSAIRQARQLNSADRIRIAETERAVRESVTNAWEGLRSASSVIESSQEQVRANEIAFEGVQQEAQVGSRTTLDVLDAEQELLDSRVALVQAERNQYVASYALLATMGELTAGNLGLPVATYDATRHYRLVRWLPFGFGIGR